MRSSGSRSSRFGGSFVPFVGVVLASACSPDEAILSEQQSALTSEIDLRLVGTWATGVLDAEAGAAEISAYHPGTARLFVVNVHSTRIDVVSIANPAAPALVTSIATPGDPTSVAVHGNLLAVASVNAAAKTLPGQVQFYDATSLQPLAQVSVGALPDMVTFTPNGRFVLTANEGEPSSDYTSDPEGSVSIIDLSAGVSLLTQAQVSHVGFDASIFQVSPDSIRLFGPNANLAQNLEPEYIKVSPDSRTAWVTLQENNAIATLDIARKRFTKIAGLGFKDHSLPENALDPSDRDRAIAIAPWPVVGMYQPDAIDTVRAWGTTFLITANEGDSRDWDAFAEESRIKDLPNLDPAIVALKGDSQLGRLTVTTTLGDTDGDGDIDRPHVFGARSFSIWTPGGEQIFDSGRDIEDRIAALLPADFNANNEGNQSFDNRSDNKGPEPEGLVVGRVFGRQYAFIGLERVGGVIVYDVTVPTDATFAAYANRRDFSATAPAAAGDLGPEGVLFISEENSPIGAPLVVLSNEVSGTATIYEVVRR